MSWPTLFGHAASNELGDETKNAVSSCAVAPLLRS